LNNLFALRKNKRIKEGKEIKCMLKSPIGLAAAAAILLLGLSPKAREIARKYAVVGTEMFLDITDQIKSSSAKIKEQLKLENEKQS
jgi:hypothetical protein